MTSDKASTSQSSCPISSRFTTNALFLRRTEAAETSALTMPYAQQRTHFPIVLPTLSSRFVTCTACLGTNEAAETTVPLMPDAQRSIQHQQLYSRLAYRPTDLPPSIVNNARSLQTSLTNVNERCLANSVACVSPEVQAAGRNKALPPHCVLFWSPS